MSRYQIFKNLKFNPQLWNEGQRKLTFCTSFFTMGRKVEPIDMAYNAYDGTGTENIAPPLVIMHGLFGSKQNWRSISKALQAKTMPQRKIIAVDARNHGESPHSPFHSYEHLAEDIAELLRQNNIQRVALMGHSMGGRAMMYFALKYPDLVEKAVIVDISPTVTSPNLLQMEGIFQAMKAINVSSELSMKDGRKVVEKHLQKSIEDKATIDFILLNLKKSKSGHFIWSSNVDALHTNFDQIAHFPAEAVKSLQYRGPVLFIGGSKSDFINKNDLQNMRKIFPNANLSWLETGHLVQLEKPAEFLQLVIQFLNSSLPE